MLDPDMCLDKVMRTERQKEAVYEQIIQLKRGTQEDPRLSSIMSVAAVAAASPEFMRRRKSETGKRDRKTTAYANDVGKTMPSQRSNPF